MRKRTKSREIALKILYAWEITDDSLDICCEEYLKNNNSEEIAVVEYAERLVSGIGSNIKKIDEMILGHATNWKLDRMATIDRNIIRIASFELVFMEDMPPKVAINEAIEMAKKYGSRDSGNFVNGILDKIKDECIDK